MNGGIQYFLFSVFTDGHLYDQKNHFNATILDNLTQPRPLAVKAGLRLDNIDKSQLLVQLMQITAHLTE